jgi:hypothetical protein
MACVREEDAPAPPVSSIALKPGRVGRNLVRRFEI